MTKRKADGDLPGKQQPKKPAAFEQQNNKTESPAAKAYRRKRAAKSAHFLSDTSANDKEAYDVYEFPATLPSPPSSTRQTPPAVAKPASTVLEDDETAHNDTANAEPTPTIAGLLLDESTLLQIFCSSCDEGLTTDAFDALMEHAAAAAKPGDELGTLFVGEFMSKLAATPINQEWLAEVIHLLQLNLNSICDRVRCQIQSLGKLPLPARERVKPLVDTEQPDDTVQPDDTIQPDDTLQPCDDGAFKEASKKIEIKQKDKSASDEEETGHPNNSVAPTQSKKSKRKAMDIQQGLPPAFKHHNPTHNVIPSENNPEEPEPNTVSSDFHPNEAPIDSAYDLFICSATAANRSATDQSPKSVKAYNKRVRRHWNRMSRDAPEKQAAWMKLFNARPDDVPLVTKGEGLLWSQDLVATLMRDDCKPKPKNTD
jgi:hypothetical protein